MQTLPAHIDFELDHGDAQVLACLQRGTAIPRATDC
jgi:hypothetical protein